MDAFDELIEREKDKIKDSSTRYNKMCAKRLAVYRKVYKKPHSRCPSGVECAPLRGVRHKYLACQTASDGRKQHQIPFVGVESPTKHILWDRALKDGTIMSHNVSKDSTLLSHALSVAEEVEMGVLQEAAVIDL